MTASDPADLQEWQDRGCDGEAGKRNMARVQEIGFGGTRSWHALAEYKERSAYYR